MLKKSTISPTQPQRAKTRLFPKHRSRIVQTLNVSPRVRLRLSLAAALLVEACVSARRGLAGEASSLFEHPGHATLKALAGRRIVNQ
jgi:hypothetical protein